jgi:hypothetical protein
MMPSLSHRLVAVYHSKAENTAVSTAVRCPAVTAVLAERACCPFLTFELIFPAPHDMLWLRLRGSEAAKEFVQSSFLLRVPAGAARE